ncbi:tyrosine-type recombinase/integrase [Shimia sp.]|uniref:tyrosine-type recombinase/integrase n=1 Tax=Shimia sp. TaxID=1954381 RepID=UPI003B8E77F2
MLEACRRPHVRDLMLLAIGTGGRISSLGSLKVEQVHLDLGVIDLYGVGIETNKRKPIVPISGPLHSMLDRLIGASKTGYLIEFGGKKSVEGRNYTQVIHRAAKRSSIPNDKLARVNWYSFRHTLADFLDEHVSGAAISSVLGHFEIAGRDRRKLFDAGSPTTELYKRRKLSPVLEVVEALDEHWWPAIQPHTSIKVEKIGSAPDLLKCAEVEEEKICFKSNRFN